MARVDVRAAVARIETALAAIDPGPGAEVRLHGAACFVDLGSQDRAAHVHDRLAADGVLALRRGSVVGYWPPATITAENLDRVVRASNEALAATG